MIEENETQETSLKDLIDLVEHDDLPTNEFTIEDKDPMVILGKLNEVIAYLQTLQNAINSSDSKASEALQKAIQAVADATQALSVANGIDDKATQALANAIEAVSTANSALSASNTALNTANTAISTANTAISSANNAVETAENTLDTASRAENKADTAINLANTANSKAQEALDQVVGGLGTKVYRDTTLLSSLDIKPIEDNIDNKVDKVSGKQLSTEDFTTSEKNKLAGLNNYDDTQVKADIANKLSLSGGTLTGNITFNKDNGTSFNTNGNYSYKIYGDAASENLYLQLKGANNNYFYYKLIDKNGKLYSDNSEVVNLSSNQSIGGNKTFTQRVDLPDLAFASFGRVEGYSEVDPPHIYRAKSGLMIQWGTAENANNTSITFLVPFVDTNYCVVANSTGSKNDYYAISITNKTTTNCSFEGTYNAQNTSLNYIIIGRWK